MRNPNSIEYITKNTSSEHIQMYGYTSASSMYYKDIADMRQTYGVNAVTTEHSNRKYWIIVTQPIFSEAASRPFKTESF